MDGNIRERENKVLGLKRGEVTRDALILFVVCYEYSLSYTNVLKLFKISDKYFWTFMEIISPMLKMGIRKASNLRKSADKMLECLADPSKSYELLTPKEEKVLELFNWIIEDSFSDGEGCLHISQFESIPSAKGYRPNGLLAGSNYKELAANVDRVAYIVMGDIKFYKISRLMYYIEKYCGDMCERELSGLSIKELMRRINDGAEKASKQEENNSETVQQEQL